MKIQEVALAATDEILKQILENVVSKYNVVSEDYVRETIQAVIINIVSFEGTDSELDDHVYESGRSLYSVNEILGWLQHSSSFQRVNENVRFRISRDLTNAILHEHQQEWNEIAREVLLVLRVVAAGFYDPYDVERQYRHGLPF